GPSSPPPGSDHCAPSYRPMQYAFFPSTCVKRPATSSSGAPPAGANGTIEYVSPPWDPSALHALPVQRSALGDEKLSRCPARSVGTPRSGATVSTCTESSPAPAGPKTPFWNRATPVAAIPPIVSKFPPT